MRFIPLLHPYEYECFEGVTLETVEEFEIIFFVIWNSKFRL